MFTVFKFGTEVYDTTLINATLSNDFYSNKPRGSRSILEDKIPGRDKPYFFGVDDTPLEFEVVFALQAETSLSDIKKLVRELIAPKVYTALSFGSMAGGAYAQSTPTYNVIFTNDVLFDFIGTGDNNVVGFFRLNARCDAPYGYYTETITSYAGDLVTNINNKGDLQCYPTITITNTGGDIYENIILKNYPTSSSTTEQSTITFDQLYANEVITINGNLKTITSNLPDPETSVYARWGKENFEIYPGKNWIALQPAFEFIEIAISYAAPQYIRSTEHE